MPKKMTFQLRISTPRVIGFQICIQISLNSTVLDTYSTGKYHLRCNRIKMSIEMTTHKNFKPYTRQRWWSFVRSFGWLVGWSVCLSIYLLCSHLLNIQMFEVIRFQEICSAIFSVFYRICIAYVTDIIANTLHSGGPHLNIVNIYSTSKYLNADIFSDGKYQSFARSTDNNDNVKLARIYMRFYKSTKWIFRQLLISLN